MPKMENGQQLPALPGTEKEAQKIVDALSPFTDVKNWNFVFASKEEIQKIMPGNAGDRLFNFIEDITTQLSTRNKVV